MRENAFKGLLKITRSIRGVVAKTSAAFVGGAYTLLMLSGMPVAFYAFSAGNFFVGSRVIGILGLVLGASATLVRIDALDRRSLDSDGAKAVAGDGGQLADASLRERIYREYVLEPRFRYAEYAFYGVGGFFMALSFIPVLTSSGF
ncbi:hypothetical protein [Halosimplex pelagicum]|uniref:Uncharacterized protein n=1 Tax=Halosimplex pelagicum TaxID=869886 RepID=A0A7D5PBC6_9EURY|nr:hypothetical protein [Halosimplex pelagicum]QLH82385.1 hypothetical protein HZS54_12490 [Halosimplex pelagicum]